MTWRTHPLDGALLRFDRDRGTNVLLRGPETAAAVRRAPRALQVGLHTRCNYACSFCYRDTGARDLLTADFLVPFLRDAARWGVLEVAFGGGEPLMFPGFVPMMRRLRRETPLALSFTTNGSLLPRVDLAALAEATAEVRLSVYENTDYAALLGLLRGLRVGVNWLVTPANVGLVEPFVVDLLTRGARSVLLLGYMGDDPGLRLSAQGIATLKRAIRRLEGLPIRLHVCWYPILADLPHLFARTDCGAGDDLLVITPDRCVQPCSFHQEKYPFASVGDVERIYCELRRRRPAATVGGCTRPDFPAAPPPLRGRTAHVWHAFSSNNSGDWTIVGRFRTQDEAERAAAALRELARAHEAFLASPDGQRWLEERGYDGSAPTPPLRRFGEVHRFDWSKDGDGLWWEEDGCGAPVLTAGRVADCVVVYHEYCMGLPEDPFRAFFERTGAVGFGYWQYERPKLLIRARGRDAKAERAIADHIARVAQAEYPSQVEEPPPWGARCADARVASDENGDARLSDGPHELRVEADGIVLVLGFENLYAGALACTAWLELIGYREVRTELATVLDDLAGGGHGPPVAPRTGLFGPVRPLEERIRGLSHEELLAEALSHRDPPALLVEALQGIPAEIRATTGFALWKERFGRDPAVIGAAGVVMRGLGPLAADWARDVWRVATAGEVDIAWRRKSSRTCSRRTRPSLSRRRGAGRRRRRCSVTRGSSSSAPSPTRGPPR